MKHSYEQMISLPEFVLLLRSRVFLKISIFRHYETVDKIKSYIFKFDGWLVLKHLNRFIFLTQGADANAELCKLYSTSQVFNLFGINL